MLTPVLLVHSPVLGPSSWVPMAELIVGRGGEVRAPDLTGVTEAAQTD